MHPNKLPLPDQYTSSAYSYLDERSQQQGDTANDSPMMPAMGNRNPQRERFDNVPAEPALLESGFPLLLQSGGSKRKLEADQVDTEYPAKRQKTDEGNTLPKTINNLYFRWKELPPQWKIPILEGDLRACKALLGKANPSLNKEQLLYAAVFLGQIDIARLLLDAGASASGENQILQPIESAVKNNDVAMVQLLLDKGADINALHDTGRDAYELSPLAQSVVLPTMTMFYFLLKNGANPSGIPAKPGKYGLADDEAIIPPFTPLMMAAQNGCLEHLLVLLGKGVDVRARDMCNDNALIHAAEQGHLDAFKCLLEHGLTIKDCEAGDPDESIFTCAAMGGNVEIVRLVMKSREECGEQIFTAEELEKAIAYAINGEHLLMLKFLLKPEFNFRFDDSSLEINSNDRLMQDSTKHLTTELFELLHAAILAQYPEWRPDLVGLLCVVIKRKNSHILRHVMTTFSIDVNAIYNFVGEINPTTLLIFAAGLGATDCVKLLLDAGARYDLCHRNVDGLESDGAVYAAIMGFDVEAMDYLLEKGAKLDDAEAIQKILQCEFRHSYNVYFLNEAAHNGMFNYGVKPTTELKLLQRHDCHVLFNPSHANYAHKIPMVHRLLSLYPPSVHMLVRFSTNPLESTDLNKQVKDLLMPLLTLAVGNQDTETVALLLAKGADVNAEGVSGYPNATTVACSMNDVAMVELLLKHGGKVNLPEPTLGWQAGVNDLLRHYAWLMTPDLSVQEIESKVASSINAISLSALSASLLPENPNTVPQWLGMLEGAGVCQMITRELSEKCQDMAAIQAARLTGEQSLSDAQRQTINASFFLELEEWLLSANSLAFDGLGMSVEAMDKFNTLLTVQVRQLAQLSEQLSANAIGHITQLAEHCLHVELDPLASDQTHATMLKEKIGLFAPFAKQVISAWQKTFKQQQKSWQHAPISVAQLMESEAGGLLLREFGRQLHIALNDPMQFSLLRMPEAKGLNAGLFERVMALQLNLLVQYSQQAAKG